MIEMLAAAFVLSGSNAALAPTVPDSPTPTLTCREMFPAASASQALKVCRTKEDWRRWQACHGSVTRYCAPEKGVLADASMGNQTAFQLSEDARIICRTVKVTGSRIQQVEACLPKREWDRMWRQGQDSVSAFQDHQSKIRFSDPR